MTGQIADQSAERKFVVSDSFLKGRECVQARCQVLAINLISISWLGSARRGVTRIVLATTGRPPYASALTAPATAKAGSMSVTYRTAWRRTARAPSWRSRSIDATLKSGSIAESCRGAHLSGGLSHRRPKTIVDQVPPASIRAAARDIACRAFDVHVLAVVTCAID